MTAQRELGGYALFDLGFDIRPNAQTEIRAITRINSDLDGFGALESPLPCENCTPEA